MDKFIDEIYFDDYEVLTPDGFKDFKGIGKTIPFQEYIISFIEGQDFICADTHILILSDGTEVFAKDLKAGDELLGNNRRIVRSVQASTNFSEMYDLLSVSGGIYNTSDVVSHNSTITVGFALHQLIFRSNQTIFLLAQNGDMAKELLSRLKFSYENLEPWIQQGIQKWDTSTVWLENGSRIYARATSKKSIRGRSANLVIADEFAHVEGNLAEEFWGGSWPTISSGVTTKFFILSTPNGYNKFHDIYSKAEKKLNDFKPIFVHWSKVPGRDEEWKKREIANFGLELFNREYECSFASSSRGLIDSSKLQEMMDGVVDPIDVGDDDSLFIYQRPVVNRQYIVCVDTAKGVEKDYSTFHVIDITTTSYRVVASYRNNKISPLVFPEVINRIALNYNKALLLIENNEYGAQILQILISDMEYPNIIWSDTGVINKQKISYGNTGKSLPGVRTTASVKNIGCSNLKALCEHDKIYIPDYNTISELSKFVRVNNSFQAEVGENDDLVMPLVLFSWLTTQDFFKELEQNVGSEIREIYDDNIKGMITSIGFLTSDFSEGDIVLDDEEDELGWTRCPELDPYDNSIFK